MDHKRGWIATIRQALWMTTEQLGRRVGIAQSGVSIAERREREKTITLRQLERIASGLECELWYELTPKSDKCRRD